MTLWIILAIVVAVVVYVIAIYNRLVSTRQMSEEAWSGIDVQLKRRADLVPNLVETVKGYASHERGVFDEVTELRTAAQTVPAGDVEARAKAEGALSLGLGRLMAVAEAYPDLKASANFVELQKELGNLESEIQMARRYYNGAVRNLNTMVESFPSNLVAGQFRFEKRQYFEIEEPGDRAVPKVGVPDVARVMRSLPNAERRRLPVPHPRCGGGGTARRRCRGEADRFDRPLRLLRGRPRLAATWEVHGVRVAIAFLFAIVCWLAAATPALAEEAIESFHSDIVARPRRHRACRRRRSASAPRATRSGAASIRDVSTTFEDAERKVHRVGFKLLGVTRDGRPEPYLTERYSDFLRIYAGDEDVFLETGSYTYVLTYETDRQVRWFDDKPELFWNVTGNDWAFPILKASASLTLPGSVAPVRWTPTPARFGERGTRLRRAVVGDGTLERLDARAGSSRTRG